MRYNLGAAKQRIPGFINVDLEGAQVTADLGQFPWDIPGHSACELMASHILEHFTKEDGRCFLAECYRILKPGGKLHVAVPDMDIFIDCINTGDWTAVNGYAWRSLDAMLGGGEREPRPAWRHKYMYNTETLQAMMVAAGFYGVKPRPPLDIDNPAYYAISLYMTGVK